MIELLVVISIITLLLAILIPSLAAARSAAQTAVCAGNVHGIMQGMAIYATDNDGWLPYQATPTYSDWSGAIAQSIDNPGCFRCPIDPNTRNPALGNAALRSHAVNSGKFTYLGNGYQCPWPPTRTDQPHRLMDVPNHVLLVGENDGHDGTNSPSDPQSAWNEGLIGTSNAVVGVAEFEGLDAYAWDMHPGGSGGVNYGFSDGHVAFMTRLYVDQWRADTDYGGDPNDPWKWK